MKTLRIMKTYTFSFAELIRLANLVILLLTRDLKELQGFNINLIIDELRVLLKEFMAIPSDEVIVGQLMSLKKERDDITETVRMEITALLARFKAIFHDEPQKIHEMGINMISTQRQEEVYRSGLQLLKFVKDYSSQLEIKGYSSKNIDEFEIMLANLTDSISKFDLAVVNREITTNNRKLIGNKLYDKMIEGCSYGKSYWINRDYVNYHGYVLYDNKANSGTIQFTINLNQPQTINLFISAKTKTTITVIWGDGNRNKLSLDESTQSFGYNYTKAGIYHAVIKGSISELTMLHLDNCDLSTISLPKKGVEALVDLSFENNNLDEDIVNALLIRLNKYNLLDGMLNLKLGTNSKPSGDGLIALEELKLKHWLIEVN